MQSSCMTVQWAVQTRVSLFILLGLSIAAVIASVALRLQDTGVLESVIILVRRVSYSALDMRAREEHAPGGHQRSHHPC